MQVDGGAAGASWGNEATGGGDWGGGSSNDQGNDR